jgi:branched-chain amino acid transport system permease protein
MGRLATLVAVLGSVAIPFVVENSYIVNVCIVIFIFVILSVGLDLVLGYCGQYSFAQGAFYGIGAYTAAILYNNFDLSFWVTMPAGILSAGLFGLLLAIPSLRLAGHFLAITTIAFQTIVYLLLTQWTELTGGQYGLPMRPIEPLSLFGFEVLRVEGTTSFYFLAFAAMAVAVLIAQRLAGSRLGAEWKAIHDDELLARAIGLNATRNKIVAFVASAALAGAGGVLIAYYLGSVYPTDFSIWTSATVVAMVVVGGRATIIGPIIGAVIFTAMPEVLRATQDYKLIIYGLLMILAITFLPDGAVGGVRRLIRARS